MTTKPNQWQKAQSKSPEAVTSKVWQNCGKRGL